MLNVISQQRADSEGQASGGEEGSESGRDEQQAEG